ncbi:hypothetical protein ANTPLA_LOCUS6494 [Anthophora plagiata]
MLPRDLGCRDYNILRGEARLLAHGSSEDNGRSVSFPPRGVEYRLLPVVQVKPDYAVPYVLCWRVPSTTTIHRIQPTAIVPRRHPVSFQASSTYPSCGSLFQRRGGFPVVPGMETR